MATAFDKWEKDPFFYAAEEVQESADRMESVYRRWVYGKAGASKSSGGVWDASAAELRRDLHAALGTAKWQLEGFERAVRCNDIALSTDEATVTRHKDFVEVIFSRIGMVEKDLKEFSLEEGERAFTWVRLDKGERDELAIFLSSSSGSDIEKVSPTHSFHDYEEESHMNRETSVFWKNRPCISKNLITAEATKNHHGVAGSITELGALTDSFSPDQFPPISSEKHINLPPPRLLNLLELSNAESSSKPKKWLSSGFKKLKAPRQEDAKEIIPLQNHQLSRGMNACYEKSKSCLSDCTDESCHKHHHEWLGALKRQLQRSQYQIQYGRPVQMMIWTIVAGLLIFLFVLGVS